VHDGFHGVFFAIEDARGAVVDFLLVAGQLDDAAFRARLPRRMAIPPRGLRALSRGRITSWPGVSRHRRLFGQGAAGHRDREPSMNLPSNRRFAITPMPPALSTSAGHETAAGLEVDEDRSAGARRRRNRRWKAALRLRAPWPAGASTALVEPPVAATLAMAFSKAARVQMSRGRQIVADRRS